MSAHKSVISWYGGKAKMAKQIINLMPRHKVYVEVFGGGGHIILNKKRVPLEVYNDVNSGLISLFRTIRNKNHFKRFQELLQLTPYSREEFEYAKARWEHGLIDNSKEMEDLKVRLENGELSEEEFETLWSNLHDDRFKRMHYKIKEKFAELENLKNKGLITEEEYRARWDEIEEIRIEDQIERARMFYVLCMQSFSAGLESWKSDKSAGNGKLNPTLRRYLNGIDKNLAWAVERFRTIQIENHSFEYILDRYDSPDTLFYLDPPYIHSTRGKADEEVLTKKDGETQEEFDERIKNHRVKYDYHHELTDDMHVLLVDKLLKIKGKFIMSGYDHPIYDRLNDGKNFFKVKLDDFAKACQATEKGGKKDIGEEFLWINFKPGE